MSLADWTDLYGADKFELSIDHVYSGAKALRIKSVNYEKGGKVLTQSITDSPTIGNAETYAYMTSVYSAFGFLFRATDVDNYYVAYFTNYTGTSGNFLFRKWVAGVSTIIGQTSITGMDIDTWYLFKVMFCEIGGAIYAEAYINGVLKCQEVDHSPSFSGGGATGVACPRRAGTTGYTWIDETKLYY